MYRLIRPLLFALDAEDAHRLVSLLGRSCLLPQILARCYAFEDSRLHVPLFGRVFASPIVLAAGFDKDAQNLNLAVFKQRVNVRLDMGFGRGVSGFIFSINEAF